MVKKIMTGLAISVGAGLALTATTRAAVSRAKNGWHPANNDGAMTPVTIRVHKAVPRGEQAGTELVRASDNMANAPALSPESALSRFEDDEIAMNPKRSLELAEIRMLIEALDQRSNEMLSAVNQRIDDLQNHLPRFIDVKVTSRIREVEERLRTEFQDEQSRTLDAFLRTLDQKILPRISMLEEAVGAQGAEIGQMRKRIEKTDETLDRVLDRMEKAVDSIASPVAAHPGSHVMEIQKKAVA